MSIDTDTRPLFEQAGELWSRRKWIFLVVFIATFSAAVTVILNLPKLYRSSATVLAGQENMSDSLLINGAPEAVMPRLQAIKYAVLSRSRLQELIESMNLYPELKRTAPFEVVLERMRKDIDFSVESAPERWGGSDAIAFTISYQGFDPNLVARVTNRLVSSYVEENTLIRSGQAAAAAVFLKQQLDEAKTELDFQQRNAAASEQRVNPETDRTRESRTRLTQLKQELTLLRSRFTEKYPDVIRLKNQIARLEREIGQGPQASRTSPDGTNHVQVSRERYLSLLKRYEDAQLAEVLEQEGGQQFRVLENAVPSKLPAAPDLLKLGLMGFVLSFLLAAGLAVLAEQLDGTFHSPRDLKNFTRVPVLVTVPRILTTGDRVRYVLWTSFVSVVVLAGIAMTVHASWLLASDNKQVVWILSERGI